MRTLSIKVSCACAIVAVGLAGCQTTQSAAQQDLKTVAQSEVKNKPTQIADVQTSDNGELKCKTERLTGSRLGNKEVCLSQQQWDDMRASNANQLRDMTLHGAKNYK
ncbi:MAG: hypothetical protein EX271_06090 [Acidimicrobiales bacterium]|nr:hypothetical protein [Hyphomonadaceae bacterium]RZV42357.1 MAG: hypothetical protein EX271_06090 [Acidimicrobiales bacterium]